MKPLWQELFQNILKKGAKKMAEGFEIQRVGPVDITDPRGPLYEWKFSDDRQITICLRKKGVKTGGHYHSGRDPSKNPEMTFIISGKIRATLIPQGKKSEKWILKAGDSINIWPNVWHHFEILEEAVIIEYRTTHFDKSNPDTFSE